MKTLAYMAIVLALTAGAANAILITDPAQGALQMTLLYDPSGSGNAWLMKNTIWSSGTATVDGYEIWSSADDLSVANWRSLQDWNTIDQATLIASLGANSTSFMEMMPTAGVLAEVTFAPGAVFQPNAPFSIGTPLAAPPTPGVLMFTYGLSTDTTDDKYLGLIAPIPEPATVALLALGGLALLKRKRKS